MIGRTDSQPNTESGDNQAGIDIQSTDYGRLLANARKAKNHSIEEVSEYLKIPAQTIAALEANDHESLPVPTFTQGYIRAYAKFLEMPVDSVMATYNRAVPHNDSSDLKPRSKLVGEANSQSPVIKTITVLLIISGAAALAYGIFQYYQEKADVLESELDAKEQRFTGSSLNSPHSDRIIIKQNARVTDDGVLELTRSNSVIDTSQSEPAQENSALSAASQSNVDQGNVAPDNVDSGNVNLGNDDQQRITENASQVSGEIVSEKAMSEQPVAPERDSIEIFVEKRTWISVRDANKSSLLYNTLPAGSNKLFHGVAPFSVNMGNAASTRVVVNNQKVDLSDHIRPNNTTKFKVSTQGDTVVFH